MNESASPVRRIALLTTGRHDWGYLAPVAEAIAASDDLALTIYCTGGHHHPATGATAGTVHACGFVTVDVPLYAPGRLNESPEIRAEDLAYMNARLVEAMRAHPCDVLVVLGDRIETLSAAVMAVADGRFLAHIHGGDRAPGELDDANRHAITKLSHVHFPATQASADRIARLGEGADRIHCVGSPGIDSILSDGLATAAEAAAVTGLAEDESFVLVLQHPCGGGESAESAAMEEICQGISESGLTAVLLGPNGDAGSDGIRRTLHKFSLSHNWPILPSVDRGVFLRLMHDAVALIGNSSAGMVESAAVDAVVIDVGPRQRGREHSENVLHVQPRREELAKTLRRVMEDSTYQAALRAAPCVFGQGQAAGRIADVLARMETSNERRIKLIEY